MQEIADEAGVNKALLHYYFRTKEQLSTAVFERAVTGFLPMVIQIMLAEVELEEKIDRVVETYLDQLTRRPYLPGYIVGELTHHPDRFTQLFSTIAAGRMRQVLRTLRGQIEVRRAAGTIAPINAEQFLITLLSSCIFPFAARPMLITLLELGPRGFDRFIDQRRKELPEFLKRALKP